MPQECACLDWECTVAISVEEGVTGTTPTHPTLHLSDYYLVKTLAHWGSCGLLSELEWKVIRASVEKRDNWGTQVTLTSGSLHFWQKLFNHLSNLHIARNRKWCHIHTLITCESTHTHTHACKYACMHTHMHAHIRTHTHAHTHTHTCTYTHTHTHTHSLCLIVQVFSHFDKSVIQRRATEQKHKNTK